MHKRLVVSAVLWFAGALAIAAGPRNGQPPASPPPMSASAPASKEAAYPPPSLAAACEKAAGDLRKRMHAGFLIQSHPPFVLAGNMPVQQMKDYVEWSVLRPAEVMWKCYFRHRPDQVITILLFTDDASYREWANRLFRDEKVPHFGYYRPRERTLVMNIDTGSGTLVHELTHALIVYDFPDVPTWFNEGLASLHEQCTIREEEIVGWVNWRLPVLKKAMAENRLRPLRELLTKDDFYGAQLGENYAQARYFVMYMQEQKLLRQFYVQLRDHHDGQTPSVKAVEAVFGKDLDQVEKAFLAWAATLKTR